MNNCCNNRSRNRSSNSNDNNSRRNSNIAGINTSNNSNCTNLDGTPAVGGTAGRCVRNTGIVNGVNNNPTSPVFVQNNITQNCGNSDESEVAGISTIIPFSSGETVALTSEFNCFVGQRSVLGFGVTQNDILINPNGTIPARQRLIAFTLPESARVRALACTFTSTNNVQTNGSVYAIKAQIYVAGRTDSNFVPLNNAQVLLQPELSGNVSEGTVFFGLVNNLNIRLAAGTRICLVISLVKISGEPQSITLLGNCEAGLSLSRTNNDVV